MVFAEATQYPPRDHCLLCCRCALVFMGRVEKSGLPTIFFVGRAFCSASSGKLRHYILPIYPALAILTGQAVAAKMQDPKRSRILYIPGIFIVAFIVYLLVGAALPNLLARDIRSDVPQSVSLLLL